MELIDRYLRAVKWFLPMARRDDIIKELSEDIQSQIEDRESELGRPLNAAEHATLIKQLGHPALLAGRYGPRRHLIGPEVFPFYALVLKLALPLAAAIHLVIAVTLLAGGRTAEAIRQAALLLPAVAFLQFACITLVFAILDRYRAAWLLRDRWNPRDLPEISDAQHASRLQPVAQLVLSLLFAFWWVAAGRFPSILVLGPGAATFKLAPAWQSAYWFVLLLTLTGIARQCLALVRPQWSRLQSALAVTTTLGGVIVLLFLLQAGDLVVLKDAVRDAASQEHVLAIVNQCIFWTLAFAAVVSVLVMLQDVRRLNSRA